MSAVETVKSAVETVISAVVELHKNPLDVRTPAGVYKSKVGGALKYRNSCEE